MGPVATFGLASPFRWVVTFVFALAAALSAQVVVTSVAWFVLYDLSRDPKWADWSVWAVKCAASPFMGGAFVVAVSRMAPTRRSVASSVALAVVVVWGGLLLVGAFEDMGKGRLHWWLFAMGLSGIGGGWFTWWFLRHRARRSADV